MHAGNLRRMEALWLFRLETPQQSPNAREQVAGGRGQNYKVRDTSAKQIHSATMTRCGAVQIAAERVPRTRLLAMRKRTEQVAAALRFTPWLPRGALKRTRRPHTVSAMAISYALPVRVGPDRDRWMNIARWVQPPKRNAP